MNDLVSKWGLVDTVFKNPTGLTEEGHYSSAYDMAMMAWHLLKDYEETITKYTSVYEDYIREDSGDPFWLVNTNKLVRFEPGVDGLKTGYTSDAGYCLTATKKVGDMRVIGVVMGASTSVKRNAEMKNLLNYGFSQYAIKEVLPKDTLVYENYDVKYDNNKMIVKTKEPLKILVKKGEAIPEITYEQKIFSFDGEYKAGDIVGEYQAFIDGELVKAIPLITNDDIGKTSFFKMCRKIIANII